MKKKLNWTITLDRFPELGIPEEEATKKELEAYEKELDKRVRKVRLILRNLESVHLLNRRSIRKDKRMPKDALFRLRLGKDLYFTGYNFRRGGGKLVLSSGINPFRTHALACSLFAFLKAKGEAKRFRYPKFGRTERREPVTQDVIWRIVNHDRGSRSLYAASGQTPSPRLISILHEDLGELKGHINLPTAARRGLVKLGPHLEISPISIDRGNGIQIYYHRTRSRNPHATDPAAEILPLVLYSYWSGESTKPKCSLSFSTVEPFAR